MSLFIVLLIISLFAVAIAYFTIIEESPVVELSQQQKIEAVDRLLPQTQCGDCGFDGCLPYAKALVSNETDFNRCLPGGNETVKELASFFGKDTKPLYKKIKTADTVALIDEAVCIGCVKCISACPVDAILGAPKQMHSIIDQYCTGCELCIAPCPVDCISMVATAN